jgi:predicted ATPase
MLLTSIQLRNIRGFGEASWRPPPEFRAGWHVVIGDNGAGKSTFLRATALVLAGRENDKALRLKWDDWVKPGATSAFARINLRASPDDEWAMRGNRPKNFTPYAVLRIESVPIDPDDSTKTRLDLVQPGHNNPPERHIWSNKPGWFSASFGPFRRFQGGDKDEEKLFYSHPKLARHLSVFGESVALSESLEWLRHLYIRKLEKRSDAGFLAEVKAFVNQPGFLPHGVKFKDVDSDGVYFSNGDGVRVSVTDLSDGFRSVLSFTFELIRQMLLCFGPNGFFGEEQKRVTVNHSGVVLVDEIDAHLHPTWQRQIGYRLTEQFPKVQFIVTTHSPLICQAAERGSVFRLATPGTQEKPRMVIGLERERLIFGSVLDAYGTELFGKDISRSASSQAKQRQLAELNQKALTKDGLSAQEARLRNDLRALYPAQVDIDFL